MADTPTTVTTANDVVRNAVISEMIIQEARANIVAGAFIDKYDLPQDGPRAITIPAFQAANMAAYSTEGSQSDASAISTDGVTITASLATLDVLIPDLLKGSAAASFGPAVVAHLGRAAADYFEKAIHALHAGLSSAVGTGGAALSLANFRSALTTLEAAAPQMGSLTGNGGNGIAAFLHPTNWGQLREEIATSGNSIYFTPANAPVGALQPGRMGLVGRLFDVPVYVTTAIVSDGTNNSGALIVPQTYAAAVKYLGQYEFLRQNELRSDRHMVTSFFGVAEIKDAWGVELLGVD